MNLQDVSHIHIPDGDVRMIHDSDNRLLWGAVGYNVLFSGNTFQQSYTGKNLANPTPVSGGSNGVVATYNSQTGVVTVSGTAQSTWSNPFKVGNAIHLTAGTYTLKQYGELTNGRITCYAQGNGYQVDASTLQKTFTVTSDGNAYICITGLTSGNSVSGTIKFQLEAGSTATDFEPFVGGQPSPNPSYPQDINVVTGTQTISINGTNYPISLGSLELCDIGGYHDYIHKVGEDWIITKRTTSILLNEYSSIYRGNFGTNPFKTALPQGSGGAENTINVISDYFYGIAYTDRTLEVPNSIFNTYVDNSPVLYIRNTPWATVEAFKSWLSGHNVKVYTKRTPTDTTITDTNLIAQLEAIYNLVRRYGYNFVVSASGNNLPIIIDRTLL